MPKAMRRLFQNKDVIDTSPQTLQPPCNHSAQRKQCSTGNKITTKATYSATVEATPKARNKMLLVKKDIKSFQAKGNVCRFCLLNS
jgi:hypothetical protein